MAGDPIERARVGLEAGLRAAGVTGGARPVVAFSGGPDSAALLALLAERGDLGVTAVHVDHGLRPSSAEEARRALEIARALGVPCELVRVEPAGKGGPEARARRARYRALAAHAGDRPVLTAHTADDQAETVLLRLARGAGAHGLAGIRPRARIEGADVRRPLLAVRREELRRVLEARGIEPVLDPSNQNPAFARNRLRATAIPALAAALPGAIPALVRAAELLAVDEAYLRRRAERALRRLAGEDPDGVDAAGLVRLPKALRGRVIRRLFERAGGPVPSREEVERILALAARGGDLHLRRGFRVRSRQGRLTVARAPTGKQAGRVAFPAERAWLVPGAAGEAGAYRVALAAGSAGEGTDPCRFELPATAKPPFLLRTVSAGERVAVPGTGSRKVRELLREAGVPAEERDRAVLLVVGDLPAWLVGIRALLPRPAPGEAAWVFTAARRRPHGNEGGAPMVGADG